MLTVVNFKDGQTFNSFKDGVNLEGQPDASLDYGAVRVQGPIEVRNGNAIQKTALFWGNRSVLGAVAEGHQFEGRIVTQDSTVPHWEGQEPMINPQTKALITTPTGQSLYRVTKVVAMDADDQDVIAKRSAVAIAPADEVAETAKAEELETSN